MHTSSRSVCVVESVCVWLSASVDNIKVRSHVHTCEAILSYGSVWMWENTALFVCMCVCVCVRRIRLMGHLSECLSVWELKENRQCLNSGENEVSVLWAVKMNEGCDTFLKQTALCSLSLYQFSCLPPPVCVCVSECEWLQTKLSVYLKL